MENFIIWMQKIISTFWIKQITNNITKREQEITVKEINYIWPSSNVGLSGFVAVL